MKKFILPAILTIALVALTSYLLKPKIIQKAFEPTSSTSPASTTPMSTLAPEIVHENLSIPWEIIFLPGGDMLVTERSGTIKRFGKVTVTLPVSGVSQRGEGGLLGLAMHPKFAENQFVYAYFTTTNGTNKIERYKLTDSALTETKVIVENIPGASNHDGGRIAFGPDDKLYVTTGDAQEESNAQNTQSLAGKILRLNDDGTIPADNPFNNAVYSYGHRNPQGIAWDSGGQLWATEHGRSGLKSGFDELNLIEKGKNYGWPVIEGGATRNGMEAPKAQSGASTTWAPADIAIINDTIYFTGLRGQSIYQTKISGKSVEAVQSQYAATYGRLRALAYHEGYLYFGTSNKDGRGSPKTGDDKIYRIRLQ